jgi:hypothetical protein
MSCNRTYARCVGTCVGSPGSGQSGFEAFVDEVTAILSELPDSHWNDEPIDVAFLPMGPGAAASAAALDDLTGRDRLTALKQRVRVQSHLQALIYEDMAAVADDCESQQRPPRSHQT